MFMGIAGLIQNVKILNNCEKFTIKRLGDQPKAKISGICTDIGSLLIAAKFKSGWLRPRVDIAKFLTIPLKKGVSEKNASLFCLTCPVVNEGFGSCRVGSDKIWQELRTFMLSYVPGGERGLRFMSSIFTGFIRKSPTTVLPI
ncbi:hypothetical protein TELCIR_01092 [Teladorsagia circumcincta]|uniref:Uncharacterized protein n=1 Tax=Teladorsagia circumcincta TaxID=45464 RepID=A0A2G9V2Y7_TELCI|nr:hypothetical protein TELCIR_01092 [Teladorsagia circumcincta]